jgi:peptide/nickel transport system substrate-binding protein
VELANDSPYTFIAYLNAVYVVKNDISGITADTVLGHHGVGIFWNVWQWSK